MATATTLYIDNITLRKILAKSTINSVIPPFQVFTSDGRGGTYWSTLSSPSAFVSAFQYISTPAATYRADASFNSIRFQAMNGLGFSTTLNLNETVLYSKGFNGIGVPLQSTLTSSSILFSSFGTMDIQTIPNSNIIYFDIVFPTLVANSTNLTINEMKPDLNIVATGDIQMETSPTDNFLTGISISTFTSEAYLSTQSYVSTTAQTLYPYMEPFYVTKTEFSTAMSNLSTTLTTANVVYNSTTIRIMSSIVSSLNLYSTFFTNSISSYINTTIPYNGVQASSMVNSISTFSSLLGLQMEPQTIASTTNIFGKREYATQNISDISNNVFLIKELVSTVSTFDGYFYESCATEAQLLSSVTSIEGILSTLNKKTIPSTSGSLFSSFSTNLTNDFITKTASTIVRANFVSSFGCKMLENNLANGMNYDLTLSTCEVNLEPLTKFIDSDSKVYVQYNPNYSFQRLRRYISDGKLLSVNEYPVSTYITYNNAPVPNLAYTDYIQFSVYPSTNTDTYTQTYSKQIYFQLDTQYLLQNNSSPYSFVHFHSSIVFIDNNNARSNVFGGIVYPASFTCDCSLVNYTTVAWTNLMAPSTSVKVFVENGLNYSK